MTARVSHLDTLTGNLLAERTCDFASWSPGETQRATATSFQVGGKGINVSKMLNRLHSPNTALCFAGGATGTECLAWLREHDFSFNAFPSKNATRSGLVVRAPDQPETTFLGPDVPPDADALLACAAFLDALPDAAALAFCGSFPGWDSPAAQPLHDALDRLLLRGVYVAADTYGAPLAWLASHRLDLVKINRVEFDRLFEPSEQNRSVSDRLRLARDRWPVHRWVITDGPREVVFIDAADSVPTSIKPPTVKEISATGSGDVLFAAMLHALLQKGFILAEAVSFALPFASANAASAGIADFPMNHLPQPRSFSL